MAAVSGEADFILCPRCGGGGTARPALARRRKARCSKCRHCWLERAEDLTLPSGAPLTMPGLRKGLGRKLNE